MMATIGYTNMKGSTIDATECSYFILLKCYPTGEWFCLSSFEGSNTYSLDRPTGEHIPKPNRNYCSQNRDNDARNTQGSCGQL